MESKMCLTKCLTNQYILPKIQKHERESVYLFYYWKWNACETHLIDESFLLLFIVFDTLMKIKEKIKKYKYKYETTRAHAHL